MPTLNQNAYELRSDEIQEIIGQVPPWIIRWGITAIFIVLLIFISCSYFIKYPDTLSASVMISTKEQPFKISWYSEGSQIYQLKVKSGQIIKPNDTVLVEKNIISRIITPTISPVGGKVYLFNGAEKEARESILMIYPTFSEYDVQLNIPSAGSGKIQIGQNVLISLDAYPVEDYGKLEGKVMSIIAVPIDGFYRANIKLKKGLQTTEDKQIPKQHFMRGHAEIMLDDKNLFHRYFGSIFS